MKNSNKLLSLNWNICNTAKPALALQTGITAQTIYQNLTTWRMDGMLFHYIGPAEKETNGYDGIGEIKGNFFIISNMPRPYSDTTRPLMGGLVDWSYCTAGNTKLIKWYPDYSVPGTSFTLYSNANTVTETENEVGDVPPGTSYLLYDPDAFYFTPSTTENKFVCGKLEVNNIMVASLGVAHAPWPEDHYTKTSAKISVPDVSYNKIIKGFNKDETHGKDADSLGGLIHVSSEALDTSGNYRSNIDAIQRRCLFQWGHPVGLWMCDTTAESMGDFRPHIRARNILGGSGNVAALPGLVISSMTEGSFVDIWSNNTTKRWSYTCPAGGIASPTLIQWDDGTGDGAFGDKLEIDGDDYDELQIYYSAASPGDEILINTIALFEDQTGLSGG